MNGRGFTLVECLVATLVLLTIAGALAALTTPVRAVLDRTLATGDVTARGRNGLEALVADLRGAAASADVGPWKLVDVAPPLRVWSDLGGGSVAKPWRALGVLTVTRDGGQAVLREAVAAGATLLRVDTAVRCAERPIVCGFQPGARAYLFDARASEAIVISAPDPASGALVLTAPLRRRFDARSLLISGEVVRYGLRTDREAYRLVRLTAAGAEQPIADHVIDFEVVLNGRGTPPQPRAEPEDPPDYGPRPPPLAEDDDRDGWGPGENCTMAVDGEGRRTPRLAVLGSPPANYALTASDISDGPWCADAADAGAFDADLLRVHRIDLTLRVQAASAAFRGPASYLFGRGGTATAAGRWVRDLELHMAIALRHR